MGVINYLIWLDQVNGVFLGVALFNKSILNLLPFPLSSVLGSEFCDWIDLPGCIYLVGSFVWSSITAVYRVLYMKCLSWMKDIIGNLPRFVGPGCRSIVSTVGYFDHSSPSSNPADCKFGKRGWGLERKSVEFIFFGKFNVPSTDPFNSG